MWTALQHSEWVTTLAASRWLYGLVSIVHYSAVFFCAGTTILMDLRILGVAARHQRLSALSGQFRAWMWTGFGLSAISGFLLFAVEAADFAAVTPFRLKILVVALAFLSALIIERSLATWDRAPVVPTSAMVVALTSLLLWLIAMLVSVEIPALTGLG